MHIPKDIVKTYALAADELVRLSAYPTTLESCTIREVKSARKSEKVPVQFRGASGKKRGLR